MERAAVDPADPMMRRLAWLAAVLTAAQATVAPAEQRSVASPDGTLVVTIATDGAQPSLAVTARGRTLIAAGSPLGLELERYTRLSDGLRTVSFEQRAGEDRYTLPAGKVSRVAERYNELVAHLREPGGAGRRLDVVVRAYDTGVAVRYRVPVQPSVARLRLVNEVTRFDFPADYACHALNLGNFGTSHEGEFDPVRASAMRPMHLYDLPMVCRTGDDGPVIAFAEADVDDYPAAYLTGTETGGPGVQIRLTRRPDDPDVAVVRTLDRDLVTPWRVVMVAASAGKLIENTLLTSLNPPARGDFSWVKPGKTSWDWWSGPVLAGVPNAGTTDATERAFIDFAAASGFAYHMVDDGWYVHSGDGQFLNPGADPTRPIAALNLPELVRYAAARRVGLFVWVHWKLLDQDMERILTTVAGWGVKGIKVDFMNRDDQQMVGFYDRLVGAAARHRLLLDLHGATHPWGMTRTWPNFITQEGVLGAEYNKWTRRITARHNITLAYTRMLAGPMDYTPGGFRNRTPATFRITATAPETQTTRGAALAMYVVYESPLQSVADTPDAYRGQSGFDFVKEVPASWDETRFLQGEIGEDVVIARRRGRTWYVGAMTDAARALDVPLSFLGTGRYRLRSWSDGASANEVATSQRSVTREGRLTLDLAMSGGGVAILDPAP